MKLRAILLVVACGLAVPVPAEATMVCVSDVHTLPEPLGEQSTKMCVLEKYLTAALADPLLCPVLASIGGSGTVVLGVVEVTRQGDVFVAGVPVVDCPPYDLML